MINIVVPMAGLGSRFDQAHPERPKPLIDVVPGRPMISYVIDFLSLSEPHRLIFVCRTEHAEDFALPCELERLAPGCEIVLTETLTSGPAATTLLAERHIDNGDELLVAYCDGFLSIDPADFLAYARQCSADGALMTYPSSGTGESYAVLDAGGRVLRTAEKQVISPLATAGVYYFRSGSDYVAAARRMIAAAPANGAEVFVCPVYNELIAAGGFVASYPISRTQRFDMGTPEDLEDVRRRLAEIPRSKRLAA